jgi:serine/threonine protein kinase
MSDDSKRPRQDGSESSSDKPDSHRGPASDRPDGFPGDSPPKTESGVPTNDSAEESTLRQEISDSRHDLSQLSTLRRGPDRIPEGEPQRLDVDSTHASERHDRGSSRSSSETQTVDAEASTLAGKEAAAPMDEEATLDQDASTLDGSRSGERHAAGDALPAALPDRYALGPLIGEGGMAQVFEAFDSRLRRPVAVKRLKGDRRDRDLLRRFQDEVEISAGLQHPGSVPVYDAGAFDGDDPFYVMKRVRGKTLRQLLDERHPKQVEDPSDTRRFVDLFERVCQAVAAAHAERIIHRDLKPSNVMVDAFEAIYVMDWGLAKHLDREPGNEQRTRRGAVLGTPAYMSPEQASGRSRRSEPEADVFSLGVILYEILAGYRPFQRSETSGSGEQILGHNPDPPRKINPRVPRALSAICMKALEEDPADRYPSAGELAADLRAYRELRPISACSPTPLDRLRLQARRRPALAATLLTALLIGAPVLFGLGSFVATERHNLDDLQRRLLEQRATLGELDREIAEIRGRLSALPDGSERRQLLLDFEQLDAERHIASIDTIGILGSIREIAVVTPDSWVIPEIQAFVLNEMRADLDNGRPVRALAIAEAVLEGERSNRLGLDAIADDVGALEARAREMLRSRMENEDPDP